MESPSSSSMGGTDILTNFSERSSRSSCSSSSSSEEDNADDDDDDGCVDDWETLADALEAEKENEKEKLLHESVKKQENVAHSASSVGVGDAASRAWRQDDDHCPQGLPNLAKHLSFPELDKRFSTVSIPSSCPICYEDLHFTDSCFLPCPCGFRLCLFCHKTISDGDGRCPGCRNPYERIIAETSLENGG